MARRLKYSGPDTDLQRLEAELQGRQDHTDDATEADEGDTTEDPYDDDPYADDPYAEYADKYAD